MVLTWGGIFMWAWVVWWFSCLVWFDWGTRDGGTISGEFVFIGHTERVTGDSTGARL